MALALLSGLCGLSVVLAVIPDPDNVTVVSYNMGVVVEWDYPHELHDNVTFTAGYRGYLSSCTTVCTNQTMRRCDFTTVLHYFGSYVFSVRAELHGEASNWVNTSDFLVDKKTTIGPPRLTLYSKHGDIAVDLQDPVMRVSTMKEIYNTVTYNITYWKEGKEKEKQKKETGQMRLMLQNLEPWTNYCVQAQVYIPAFKRNGELSRVVCNSTTSDGKVKPWVVGMVLVVSFLVSSVCVLLMFLVGRVIYRSLRVFYPNAKLPEHFKQYLNDPTHSYIFMTMPSSPQEKEVYHPVVILSEDAAALAGVSEELREVGESSEEKMGMEKDLLLQPA